MNAEYARRRLARAPLIFRYRVRATILAQMIRRCVGPGEVALLDIGSADGLALIEVARQLGGGRFVGVEYSPELLAMAPKDLPGSIRFIQGDAMALPAELKTGRFDAASALAILEHLPDPVRALRELWTALRPGGLLFATSPNPSWDRLSAKASTHADEHHVQRINVGKLAALVTEAGFERLRTGRFMWAPLAVLPYARIPVPPRLSHVVDAVVDRIPLLRLLCVNAYVVASKPI